MSAHTVGVESVRLSNSLMMPGFSATKTRPSAANSTAVGRLRPLMTAVWPDYDEYQERTDRQIPVVVLEPR